MGCDCNKSKSGLEKKESPDMGGGGGGVEIDSSEPTTKTAGMLWVDTDSNKTFRRKRLFNKRSSGKISKIFGFSLFSFKYAFIK